MDLTTSYLGLTLAHPYVAGASPLGADLDHVKRLEDAGCAAIVLPSLFEEQITYATTGKIRHRDPRDPDFAAVLSGYPAPESYLFSPDAYAEHVRRVKAAVAVPVIASLNGTCAEFWARYALALQEAGADALELNLYRVVTDAGTPGVAVETGLRDLVVELKQLVRFPIAMKLLPFFTAFGQLAHQLDRAGLDGLVLFNRFYQPDIDVQAMRVVPSLELSHRAELLLRLRWLAILRGHVKASLAASGGVDAPEDGVKALLAGADVVQLVSALLRHGPSHVRTMRLGLERWMEAHRMTSINDMRGRLRVGHVDSEAAERAGYLQVLQSLRD
jgi:dihydroorotate dehydrogenase (fumarate)